MKTKLTKQAKAVPFYLVFMAVLFTNTVSATVIPDVDWSNSFLFEGTGGLENPLLRVAFNPQPEPPNPGILSFRDPIPTHPPDPVYPPDPVITHSGDFVAGPTTPTTKPTFFRLLFGISNGSSLSINEGTFTDIVGGGSAYGFQVLNESGGKVFDVHLELVTSSGGSPLEWMAFNPQPEPPRIGTEGAAFGADFTFDSFSDASLAIRIHDAQGSPITLNAIPEPTTLALMSLGLAGIGYQRHRSKKAA